MTRDLIIGIDAGTSVIKSVAFTTAGVQIAMTAIPNRYQSVAGGGSEQDIARTWTDAAQTLQMLADAVPNLAARVAAISVTGQGDGTWLIDKAGEPVAPAWLWLDARAADIVDAFHARPEDRARFELTGTGLAACQTGPQLLWMKQHRPAVLDQAATAFHCKDWLYYKLTGDIATDPSEMSFSFGDFRKRVYSDAVIDMLGLASHRRLLPEVVEGTEHHGALSPEAARLTGLTAGTPVVLGYVDIMCTALGAGLYDIRSDAGCTVIGSTGMHMRLARSPEAVVLNAESTGYTMPLPAPGAYARMQSNMAATLNIDWIVDLIGGILAAEGVQRSRKDVISRFDDLVHNAAPGTLLYHPYISEAGERGPFIDVSARAGFYGLSVKTGHGDLVRGVYEGLAFASRDCYTAMGGIPGEIRLSGGAARSRTLRGILGAVLQASVRTSRREEAGAAGAAMMAAVSLGLYADMDACVDEWVRPQFEPAEAPDTALAGLYDDLFRSYVGTQNAMRPHWRALAQRNGADRVS